MSPDDRHAIEQTLQTYFDGLYEGDADKLASVFHATSALTWEQDGQGTICTLAQWLEAHSSPSAFPARQAIGKPAGPSGPPVSSQAAPFTQSRPGP